MSERFIHPTAIIDADVELGAGVKIWHFVHVSSGARIGAGTSLGQNVFVGAHVRVGARVKVQNNVSLYEGVEIDDDVFLGPSCVFTNVLNPRAFVVRKNEFRGTYVERGASIGANATIVCGHRIGAYAFVAAGATVTHDVPPFALMVSSYPPRTATFAAARATRTTRSMRRAARRATRSAKRRRSPCSTCARSMPRCGPRCGLRSSASYRASSTSSVPRSCSSSRRCAKRRALPTRSRCRAAPTRCYSR
jgi:UDP-2-acetamido-3-amino-2,3-dideoxy-glucuronate N-acetyltransferase